MHNLTETITPDIEKLLYEKLVNEYKTLIHLFSENIEKPKRTLFCVEEDLLTLRELIYDLELDIEFRKYLTDYKIMLKIYNEFDQFMSIDKFDSDILWDEITESIKYDINDFYTNM